MYLCCSVDRLRSKTASWPIFPYTWCIPWWLNIKHNQVDTCSIAILTDDKPKVWQGTTFARHCIMLYKLTIPGVWIGVGCSGAKQQQGNFSWGQCLPEAFALSFFPLLSLSLCGHLCVYLPLAPFFLSPSLCICYTCLSFSRPFESNGFALTWRAGVWDAANLQGGSRCWEREKVRLHRPSTYF